ncbi:hypothetical protein AB0B63_06795 [Micromonospora sp. NPDC049081]|uniref:hypothetical protein n=1 Tax=Micromonospora sp. NPDC049081 TaxID=3155150 RepID=UPI0033E7C9B8
MTDTTTPADHLHALIAAAAQREYEDSTTTAGTIANPEHLGSRIAAEVMKLFGGDIQERWEVRGTDPDFDGGWYSYVRNQRAAVRRVSAAREKPGSTASAYRMLLLETVGEPVEVQP